jgi:6-phosphogluconolactonase
LNADPGRLVVMNEDPSGRNPLPRMTLTFAGITRARLVLVTVSGEEKREALARVRRDDSDCPGSHIRADRVVWLVDPAAAGD